MPFFIWILGFFSLLKDRYNLLIILLSIEVIILSIFYQLIILRNMDLSHVIILFIVIIVIEACMRLSVIVIIVYYYGTDILKRLNIFNI